jgi:hypothetical protein
MGMIRIQGVVEERLVFDESALMRCAFSARYRYLRCVRDWTVRVSKALTNAWLFCGKKFYRCGVELFR